MSKIIQSGGFLDKTLYGGNVMGDLGKKTLRDLAVPLAKDILSKLASKATSSILDKFETNKWERSFKSWKRIHFIYYK